MNVFVILGNTIREGFAKKTIIGLIAISTFFLILMLLFAVFVDFQALLKNEAANPDFSLALLQRQMLAAMLSLAGFPAMVLAIFATAGIMTSSLEKGYIDLLLSKPITRLQLLMGRFLGALTIILANFLYVGIGLWIISSIKFGSWEPSVLLASLVSFSGFAVILPVMMLLGLYVRSTAVILIITYVYTFIVNGVLSARDTIHSLTQSDALLSVMTVLYHIVPKPSDITEIAQRIVIHAPTDWMPLVSSAISSGVLLALTAFLFTKKDL